MKYYSDLTKKLYDSTDELKKAEDAKKEEIAAEEKKKESRAAAAEEVKLAFEEAQDAYEAARKKLNDFCKEYGSFHCSFSSESTKDFVDTFFGGCFIW